MATHIPRFQSQAQLVSDQNYPTQTFHIWWDTVASGIEGQFDDITGVIADIQTLQTQMSDTITDLSAAVADIQTLQTQMSDTIADQAAAVADIQTLQTQMSDTIADLAAAVADIAAAQAAADAAQADADAAAQDAINASREAARINSYMNPGAGVLSATDAGSDATITIANHTRVYPVEGSLDVPDVSITGASITGLAYSTRYYIYYDDTTLSVTAPTFNATTTSATAQVGAASGRHFVGYITTPASGAGGTTGDGGGPPGGGGGGGGGGGVIP